jgi:exoribonuclease R
MPYRITINDMNYTSWSVEPLLPELENSFNPILDTNFNPIQLKLFNNDTIDEKYNIINSPIRNNNILGVLVLNNFQSYGKMYKVIPRDNKLPHFLVPYEIKKADMGFHKNIQNKYVVFKFMNWDSKHPIGQLVETIGPINDLSTFYKYELYHKKLNISLTAFNKKVSKTIINFDDPEIIQKYNIENRQTYKVFSIDPEGCTDIDDAFSIIKKDENYLISIYISNVPIILDYLNLWDSLTDRISTIYLPDGKIPMLPNILSENICSLKEKETRFAFCIDILVDSECNIITTSFKNVSIKLKHNFAYDSPSLLSYNNYIVLYNLIKKKYTINDSHELVAQLMILMNNKCAEYLQTNKIGIFRSTIPTKNKMPEFLISNNFIGRYTSDYTDTEHKCLNLDTYTHITSPIRRIVDILNMIKLMNLVSADEFYNKWITRIDYINEINRNIKKLQSQCELLHLFTTNPSILDKIYEAYYVDEETMYIPELKVFNKIINKDLELYNKYDVKLYLFDNYKIKIDLL